MRPEVLARLAALNRAFYAEQGEAFACKIIRPDLIGSSPDAMRRLMREARTNIIAGTFASWKRETLERMAPRT